MDIFGKRFIRFKGFEGFIIVGTVGTVGTVREAVKALALAQAQAPVPAQARVRRSPPARHRCSIGLAPPAHLKACRTATNWSSPACVALFSRVR